MHIVQLFDVFIVLIKVSLNQSKSSYYLFNIRFPALFEIHVTCINSNLALRVAQSRFVVKGREVNVPANKLYHAFFSSK